MQCGVLVYTTVDLINYVVIPVLYFLHQKVYAGIVKMTLLYPVTLTAPSSVIKQDFNKEDSAKVLVATESFNLDKII